MVGTNESERHIQYKGKVANVLRKNGFTVFGDSIIRQRDDDEVSIIWSPSEKPYYIDICACGPSGIVLVEIDGYRGHRSRRAICKDKNRTATILDYFSNRGVNARLVRFAFFQLKGASDELIAEELGI